MLVLCLQDSNAALKMDAKLECEVDVEGTVDMIDCGEAKDERMMRWERASIVAAHRPRPTDPRDPLRTFVGNPAPINFLFLNRVLYGSMQCSWVLSKTHKRTRYNHLEADEGWFGLYVGSVCRCMPCWRPNIRN